MGRLTWNARILSLGATTAMLALTLGCVSQDRNALPPALGHDMETASTLPPWTGMPSSWKKLGEIDSWLKTDHAYTSTFWNLEGRLQLAEGRLEFASSDLKGTAPTGTMRERVLTAHVGFQRVLSNGQATAGQVERADAGKLGAERLLTGVSASTAPATAIITRGQWGASATIPHRLDQNGSRYEYITLHHSAMPNPPQLSGSLADSAAAVRQIQRGHMVGTEKMGDIGYHFLVDPFGRVFQGRDVTYQGAHAGGTNNRRNLGICLIGNFDLERPTAEALGSLNSLVNQLRGSYGIPAHKVVGHSRWKNTACPGKHLATWLDKH